MPIDPAVSAELNAISASVNKLRTLLDVAVEPPPPPPPAEFPTFTNVSAEVTSAGVLEVKYDLTGDPAKLATIVRVGLGVGHSGGFIGFTELRTGHTGIGKVIRFTGMPNIASGGFDLLQSTSAVGNYPPDRRYSGIWSRTIVNPPPPPPLPVGGVIGTEGFFRVKGADVLDPANNVFRASGTNATGGTSYEWGLEWNPHNRVAQWKAAGINVIRHVFYTVVSPGNHPVIQRYGNLDDLVRECETNQVMLIVDYHNGGLGEWWPDWCVSDAITVFNGLAQRFPDNKYLAFELKNEPLEEGYGNIPAPRDWCDKHLTIGRAVRQTGFKGLIFACPSHFGQDRGTQDFWNDSQSAIMSFGDELQREIGPVVFSPHFYSRYGGNATDQSVKDQLARYRSTGKPIICSELGAYNGGFEIVRGDRQGAERLFRLQMSGQAPGIGQIPWILSASNGPLSRGDDCFGLLHKWIDAGKP